MNPRLVVEQAEALKVLCEKLEQAKADLSDAEVAFEAAERRLAYATAHAGEIAIKIRALREALACEIEIKSPPAAKKATAKKRK